MTHVALFLALTLSSLTLQQRLDGNWWEDQDPLTKVAFSAGMLVGVNDVSWLVYTTTEDFQAEDLAKFMRPMSAKMKGITPGQLNDGLEEFYKDFRNRRIHVGAGAHFVIAQITGMPEAELNTLIEWLRKQ